MNRHSLFFKLNLLFSVALISTIIGAFILFGHQKARQWRDDIFKIRLLLKEQHLRQNIPTEFTEMLGLEKIEGTQKREILQNGFRRQLMRMPREHRRAFRKQILIRYQGERYLFIKNGKNSILLHIHHKGTVTRQWITLAIFGVVILFLIVLYLLIRRSLLPLKKLEKSIIEYGEGKMPKCTQIDGKDEIARVNNAFCNATQKVQMLTNSRQLFIRNLFHELNTPVTKGKLLAEISEDAQTKNMLNSIFNRLSILLQELARMEQISSKSYKLKLKPVRIVELIDHARDLLYIEEPIDYKIDTKLIEADFNAMSLVFKNLIDNGRKYGTNFKIRESNNMLCFESKGEPLQEPLSYYTQAFVKKEGHRETGFGLGLYIVQEILTLHNMKLEYNHKDGINLFCLSAINKL